MKKILILLTALIGFSVIFSSCSDDKSTNPNTNPEGTNNTYFITKKGSYWIYKNKTDDPNNNTSDTKDSIYLNSIESKDGKDAYICDQYTDTNDDGTYETKSENSNFYATETSKLYLHKDSFFPPQFGPGGFFDLSDQIVFKSDWVKIVDENDDDWKILDSKIDMTLPGLNLLVKGNLISTGENTNKTKDVVVKGETIKTYGYKVNINFNGDVTIPLSPIPVSISFTSTTTYWVAKGIGPVLIEVAPITIGGAAAAVIPSQPGSTSTLETYFIAK